QKVDAVNRRGVQLTDLCRRDSAEPANLLKVRSVLCTVAHRDLHLPRLERAHFLESPQIAAQFYFELLMPPPQRIEFQQYRTIGRMQIAHARYGLELHQPKESSHLLMRLKRYPLTEIDQQRLIACGTKLHTFISSHTHAGESIPTWLPTMILGHGVARCAFHSRNARSQR